MSFDSISRRFSGKTTDKPWVPPDRTVLTKTDALRGPNGLPAGFVLQDELDAIAMCVSTGMMKREEAEAQAAAWRAQSVHAADGAAWPEPEADGPQSVAKAMIRLEALLERRHADD